MKNPSSPQIHETPPRVPSNRTNRSDLFKLQNHQSVCLEVVFCHCSTFKLFSITLCFIAYSPLLYFYKNFAAITDLIHSLGSKRIQPLNWFSFTRTYDKWEFSLTKITSCPQGYILLLYLWIWFINRVPYCLVVQLHLLNRLVGENKNRLGHRLSHLNGEEAMAAGLS